MARPTLSTPAADNTRQTYSTNRPKHAPKKLQTYAGPGRDRDEHDVRGLAAYLNDIGGAIRGTRPDRAINHLTI